jgi:hypothetical protein
MGFLTPLVTAVTAWALFGIYQIGYSIEDPFQGSLRLSILCDSIRRDVLVDNDSHKKIFQDSYLGDSEDVIHTPNHSVQSMFSNGTIVDSTIQPDLDVLMDPPKLVAENGAKRIRSIRVDSLP